MPEREHLDWLDALSRVWDKRDSWYDNELFKNLHEPTGTNRPAEQNLRHEWSHRMGRRPHNLYFLQGSSMSVLSCSFSACSQTGGSARAPATPLFTFV